MLTGGLAEAYLAALDLDPESPGLEPLSDMVRRHVARYPFASVGPRLGDPLPLDEPALLDRVVTRRRGGYCFEHNGLFSAVLEALGYDVRLGMARVLVSGVAHPGLTHRFTEVRIDGADYLVDVGFGPTCPARPVPMQGEAAGTHRVVPLGDGGQRLEVREGNTWSPLYRFDAVAYGPADAEVGHFYSHRHPEAPFVTNLVASLILDHEVRSLRNLEYHVICAGGRDVEVIEDASRLHTLLTEELCLDVTPDESESLFAGCRA